MTELPLACNLDAEGVASQGRRYAELGGRVEGIERDGLRLTVRFDSGLDEVLLRQALEVERACCPFFSIAFDLGERKLELAVPGSEHASALDAIQSALT